MSEDKLHFMYVMHPTDPSKAASRDAWTDYDRETFGLHMAHLNGLLDQGKLILAGRALDQGGDGLAICIYTADSAEEGQRIFEAEPFVTRGFCTAVLHPFSSPITKDSE
jgi:uncharacterized protein